MRVLVTGGAGFLGSVLAQRLLLERYQVSVLDTLEAAPRNAAVLESIGVRVHRGDVRDPEVTLPLIAAHDAVVHLAAVVGYPACDAEPELAQQVNVDSTRLVAGAVEPHQHLVFASTGSVYGAQEDVCTETSVPDPQTHYGRTKLAAEAFVRAAGGTSIRFATLMGPSPAMRFDLLPNDLTWQAVKGEHVEIYQADAHRTFLDVRDAARAVALLLALAPEERPEVVNVGETTMNLTKRELGGLIGQMTDTVPAFVDGLEDPDQRDYDVDYGLVASHGFRARYSMKQSLEDIARLAAMCPDKEWLRT